LRLRGLLERRDPSIRVAELHRADKNRRVTRALDPEGAHLAALLRLADFDGARVLEMGCGEGRLTRGIAVDAASVLAFDPDGALVEEAQAALPVEVADRVAFRVAKAEEIEIERGSFDLVVFSWSL
jgi:2-polyprenyl-3-methyl-5-hydroxy-6-metoxy-1,4-benzoquinol methylase